MAVSPTAKETGQSLEERPANHAATNVADFDDKEGAKTHHVLQKEPTREEKTAEAIAEGHDADIPSSLGYVLDERGEEQRRRSIARQRTNSLARKTTSQQADLEKGGLQDKDGDGGESSDDENIVWWDGPDDPANPYNWPTWLKVLNCALISAMTFVTPLASSIFAPGVPELMKEFHNNSPYLAAFVVSGTRPSLSCCLLQISSACHECY